MNEYNATCPICSKKFKICKTCSDHDLFSWKTVTDTEDCFEVFTILHKYSVTNSITKDEAKAKLSKCDLSGLNEYPEHIKKQITDIVGVKAEKAELKKDNYRTSAKAEKTTTK